MLVCSGIKLRKIFLCVIKAFFFSLGVTTHCGFVFIAL